MPRAEVGSTKYLNNKLKAKGLQRLRWYCQICERQMRDENGFKQHCMSESHVRQMQLVGEDPRKFIEGYSKDFFRDFVQLLRTAHGTKAVHINHFYQEYIANKEHIHMNATKWPSLTEFAKHLGREGICRVEETDKGLHIAWIDNSPEAMRRQEAIRKKERQDKDDETREQALIRQQIERARAQAKAEEEQNDEARALQRTEGEKIKLNFGAKPATPRPSEPTPTAEASAAPEAPAADQSEDSPAQGDVDAAEPQAPAPTEKPPSPPTAPQASAPAKISLGMSMSSKPKNVFSSKGNPLAAKKAFVKEPPKKMSEAERIMKEELERKRLQQENPTGQNKRIKLR